MKTAIVGGLVLLQNLINAVQDCTKIDHSFSYLYRLIWEYALQCQNWAHWLVFLKHQETAMVGDLVVEQNLLNYVQKCTKHSPSLGTFIAW